MIQSLLGHARLKQFLKRHIAAADRSLRGFVVGDTRYNFNKAIISE